MIENAYQGDENHRRSLRAIADHPSATPDLRARAAAELARAEAPVNVPAWLDQVLAKHAVLDLNHPDARRELAAALVAAAGGHTAKANALMVAETIAGSAKAVLKQKIASTHLKQHVLIDAEYTNHLAREIGNNAAATVVLVIAVGPDED